MNTFKYIKCHTCKVIKFVKNQYLGINKVQGALKRGGSVHITTPVRNITIKGPNRFDVGNNVAAVGNYNTHDRDNTNNVPSNYGSVSSSNSHDTTNADDQGGVSGSSVVNRNQWILLDDVQAKTTKPRALNHQTRYPDDQILDIGSTCYIEFV